MRVLIPDNKWLYLDQVIGAIEPVISKAFSARHTKIKFIDTKQQMWDGWYRKYDTKNSRMSRALLKDLIELCDDHKIPYEIDDLREPPNKPPPTIDDIKPDMLTGITLEPHQIEALKSIVTEEVGLISVPTGGGKTELLAATTKLYNLPTVIIAEQRVVIEQIKERLELRDVVDVGLFYGGEQPNGQMVVVGSIQSLDSPPASLRKKNFQQWKARVKNSKIFQDIVKKAGLLLVDEVDRATSKPYRRLYMNLFKGRYKFGFSGTCFDPSKPVEALILKEHAGSIIYEVSRSYLEKIGRIIPIKACMIAVGEDGDKADRMAYDFAEKELMVENDDYHQAVKKLVDSFPNDKTLVLVDTNHIEGLGKALESKIENSMFIYGKTRTKARNQAIKDFQDGKLKCLIGSKILKRGLDIKGGVHNLIICGGGKLHSDFNQKIGRAVRNNDKGFARLFFFLHLNNHYLYKHSREQLKCIVSLGYTVKVIARGKQIDGERLINSRFSLLRK